MERLARRASTPPINRQLTRHDPEVDSLEGFGGFVELRVVAEADPQASPRAAQAVVGEAGQHEADRVGAVGGQLVSNRAFRPDRTLLEELEAEGGERRRDMTLSDLRSTVFYMYDTIRCGWVSDVRRLKKRKCHEQDLNPAPLTHFAHRLVARFEFKCVQLIHCARLRPVRHRLVVVNRNCIVLS